MQLFQQGEGEVIQAGPECWIFLVVLWLCKLKNIKKTCQTSAKIQQKSAGGGQYETTIKDYL